MKTLAKEPFNFVQNRDFFTHVMIFSRIIFILSSNYISYSLIDVHKNHDQIISPKLTGDRVKRNPLYCVCNGRNKRRRNVNTLVCEYSIIALVVLKYYLTRVLLFWNETYATERVDLENFLQVSDCHQKPFWFVHGKTVCLKPISNQLLVFGKWTVPERK